MSELKIGRTRYLRCYVAGRGRQWEAICTSLDISVNATSEIEVRQRLQEAVATYVKDALAEAPDARERLLNRKSPWWVSAAWQAGVAMAAIWPRHDDRQLAAFGTPCPS